VLTALRATGLRKSFAGVEVVHGVDLALVPGQVLALLGENGAGKSTVIKMLAGDHRPDAGTIEVGAETFEALDPGTSRRHGIRTIFQELTDAPPLTVMENICLGRWPRRGVFRSVDWQAMRSHAVEVLGQLDAHIDPAARMSSLAVGERQLVEIARAVSDQARILILDEPTAALSSDEVDRLFGFIGRLRQAGVAMVYITHRLDEIPRIADRVQVLRDGSTVLEGPVGELDRPALVSAMIGRTARAIERPGASAATAQTALDVRNASVRGAFGDASLAVRRGEVVALYGKVGSGIAEVAEAVYGLHKLTAGSIDVSGRSPALHGPRSAMAAGIGFLPADRKSDGVLPDRPVAENLSAPSWRRMASAGLLTRRPERVAYERWRSALGIRARSDPRQPIETLSGGNQQKVLLARWLERAVELLVLVEPTRGVDVGARQDIYATLRRLAAGGAGVLVATSDYEEVVQLADRALVMVRGRIVAELAGDAVTTAALIDAAGG
jgi:ribose transport system ATP-binding protein